MDLFEQSQSVDSVDRDKSSCSGSGAVLLRNLSIVDTWKKISLEKPVSFWGESKYLTHLWVSRNEEPREELHSSDSSQSKFTCTSFFLMSYLFQFCVPFLQFVI